MKKLLFLAIPPFLAFIAQPHQAFAHAVLIKSRPEAGATVSAGPTNLDLTFDSRVDARRSRLFLKMDGKTIVLKPESDGASTTDLFAEADLSPGACTLAYEVLSIDGHVTKGEIDFTVAER